MWTCSCPPQRGALEPPAATRPPLRPEMGVMETDLRLPASSLSDCLANLTPCFSSRNVDCPQCPLAGFCFVLKNREVPSGKGFTGCRAM